MRRPLFILAVLVVLWALSTAYLVVSVKEAGGLRPIVNTIWCGAKECP